MFLAIEISLSEIRRWLSFCATSAFFLLHLVQQSLTPDVEKKYCNC